uniref:Uncharacterized protein n=1 Tax=Xenopus tropicalis TaxID=8364 RepID=A0A1B8XUA9_XENTR
MNHLQLITFTKARDKSDFWENGECSNKKDLNASNKNITGEEARSFYESLLETEDQQSHSKKSSRKPKPAILSVQHRVADTQSEQNTTTAQDPKEQHKGHQLLRCSQEGDLKGLKRLVDKEKYGEGRKFPVKTLLKRDKKGLGFHTDQKSKVTHFSANDNMAVANVKIRQKRTERISTISRKEEKRKQAKEQAWERNLRTYMNIDL